MQLAKKGDFQKLKFSLFGLHYWMSFGIFAVTYRVTNFFAKTGWHAIYGIS